MNRDRLRDAASLALLTLVVAGFFWPLLFTQAWIPRSGGDLVSFLWPMARFSARSLRSGTVPLWNPHLYSGAPFVADNQTGIFYPINLIAFAVFGPPSCGAMEGLVVLHIWLAAVGTFVLLRSFQLRRPAAALGAIAFALSDLFITHLGNLNLNATAAWLPLILWAAHRALERRSASWAAVAGALLAVAALAGHAQMLLFVGLALGLLTLYHLAVGPSGASASARQERWPRIGQTLALALLIAAIGLGGAALMLLPAYQMTGHTGRGQLPYSEATRYSLPPRALLGLIAPGFYGRGPAGFWGPWDRVEVGYVGVAAFVLAAVGLALGVRRRLRREFDRRAPADLGPPAAPFPLGYFALLVVLGFLLALGRHTPLYRLLYRFVPTFDQIRAPARLIVLADLGLAALAAYGLHHLIERGRSLAPYKITIGAALILAAALLVAGLLVALGLTQARSVPPPSRVTSATRSIVVAAGLLVLTGLGIALARWRSWAAWFLPLLLAGDLIALGSMVEVERNDPTLGYEHPDVVAFLKDDPSFFRIEDDAASWQPDAALVHGLYDIGGVYNPLGLAPYQAYRWAIGERGSPLYNLLGVKYVLAGKGDAPGEEPLVPVHSGDEVDIYLNTAALPRALFVTDQQVVDDHEAAWQAIHDPDFDPARTVVLERAGTRPRQPSVDLEPAHLAFTRYDLNRLALTVRTPESGWLVLSDVFYPGWRAAVDGRPAPVLRADYVFRAVPVPAGAHQIEMIFAPPTWYIGLALSGLTWLGLAAAAIVQCLRS